MASTENLESDGELNGDFGIEKFDDNSENDKEELTPQAKLR